jgi:hypothetical protein
MNLMKLATKLIAAARTAAWLAVLVAPFCTALGQGSLMPVGPPAPTMKTLDQIEARTPISSAPFTISQSGSYYLTNNLTVAGGVAITITASDVSLDLNGFTISSTAASPAGFAIHIFGAPKNLVIRNGLIQSGVTSNGGTYSGSGFSHGIIYSNTPPVNVRVTDLTVTGVAFNGIYLGWNATAVESCTVLTAGSVGIFASTIKNSIAEDCGSHGIFGQLVSDCRGVSSGSGEGVVGDTVLNSYGVSQSGDGVAGQTVQNCYGKSNTRTGVYAQASALNCYGFSSSGIGIYTSTAENCYGYTDGDAYGVYAQSAQNCRGYSGTGRGVFADTAENCYGVSGSGVGGAGIFADIAQNCRGSSSTGTEVSATTALNCTGYTTAVTATAKNCSELLWFRRLRDQGRVWRGRDRHQLPRGFNREWPRRSCRHCDRLLWRESKRQRRPRHHRELLPRFRISHRSFRQFQIQHALIGAMKASAILASFFAALFFVGGLPAQVPQLINYQGRVAVGGANFDGTGQFKFALVNAAGTVTFWSNNGTSVAGSQPTAAVSLVVTKGLYSVLLGDTSLANMTAIPASVFNNSDVRLRVWFNDGINGSQQLSPDQRIAAVGYAVIAGGVPNGAITSSMIANGAVGNTQLAAGAVQSGNIAAGAVGSSQLATGAVTTSKVAKGISPPAAKVRCRAAA